MSQTPQIQRLPQHRVQSTMTFTEGEVARAEDTALKRLGSRLRIPGFRPGMAPANIVRQNVDASGLLEQTVRSLLPEKIEALVKEHGIKPILPPKIEITTAQPLTVTVTFVERPEVKIKNLEKI